MTAMRDGTELLEDNLDGAIRRGLRDAGVKGELVDIVNPVLRSVVETLTRPDLSTEEIADALEEDHGVMRISDGAIIDGHHVPPGRLVDGFIALMRRDGRGLVSYSVGSGAPRAIRGRKLGFLIAMYRGTGGKPVDISVYYEIANNVGYDARGANAFFGKPGSFYVRDLNQVYMTDDAVDAAKRALDG